MCSGSRDEELPLYDLSECIPSEAVLPFSVIVVVIDDVDGNAVAVIIVDKGDEN